MSNINKTISKNFNLSEFLDSQEAVRKGYKEQFQPSDEVIDNIEYLVLNLLQPLRDLLPNGYFAISSGYRCQRVNEGVGGSVTSQHMTGQAADVIYYEGGKKQNLVLYNKLIESKFKFDQVIKEFGTEANPAWIHISLKSKGMNRMQKLRIK